MSEVVKCLECGKAYKCVVENTEFNGSIIKTTCPYCNKTINRNIGKFLEIQTTHITDRAGGYLKQARTMISMAKSINSSINSDNFKKKYKR